MTAHAEPLKATGRTLSIMGGKVCFELLTSLSGFIVKLSPQREIRWNPVTNAESQDTVGLAAGWGTLVREIVEAVVGEVQLDCC
jgi:hypothetical protein